MDSSKDNSLTPEDLLSESMVFPLGLPPAPQYTAVQKAQIEKFFDELEVIAKKHGNMITIDSITEATEEEEKRRQVYQITDVLLGIQEPEAGVTITVKKSRLNETQTGFLMANMFHNNKLT